MTQVTAQDDSGDDKKVITPVNDPISTGNKEVEPASVAANFEKEGKLITEIKEVSAEADRKAEHAVKQELNKLGEEVQTREASHLIPEDVQNAGVKDIAKEASEVISVGHTINLDVTEQEYEEGLKAKVGGTRTISKSILNVSSIVALAIWIGRQLKRAHGKTMNIVFKKGVSNAD